MARKQAQSSKRQSRESTVPQRVTRFIADLPRLIRVLMVGVFALAVTLSLSPFVDYVYDRYFFSLETVLLPALISSAFGLVMYMVGWWLIVGTVGEKPEARAAMLWYVGIGLVAVIVVAYLLVIGVSLLNFGE